MTDSTVQEFFDAVYGKSSRYWWQVDWRYSAEPDDHVGSILTATLLQWLRGKSALKVLDLGAGEGADAIRIAQLGHDVTAVDISATGCDKIQDFARQEGVSLHIENDDTLKFLQKSNTRFDVIIMHGILHYVASPEALLREVQCKTAHGGVNSLAAFSRETPIPEPHLIVPVFQVDENSLSEIQYGNWSTRTFLENNKLEQSHSDFPPHRHSFVKIFATKPERSVEEL